MKPAEIAFALGLAVAGCPASLDENLGGSSGGSLDECDRAREPIQAILPDIPPEASAPCEDVRRSQELVHTAALACGSSPSAHLALAHMERALRDTRPDCFRNAQ